MIHRLSRRLLAVLATATAAAAVAQQPSPPNVPLWRTEANGDAVQQDLGFILPARWKNFERKGFTSTREDGGSVKTYYVSSDGALRLNILLQLRVDVRGFPMPGADPIERSWPMSLIVPESEYLERTKEKPEVLQEEKIVWGRGEKPNARMRLVRYSLEGKPEIQGFWMRNIGLWNVDVTVAGPESRRAEVESTGRAVMNEMAWPSAPLGADLRAVAPLFVPALKPCSGDDRSGGGKPVKVDGAIASLMGIGLTNHFLDNRMDMPHPVLHPDGYCRIERFKLGAADVVALRWQGAAVGGWEARYAFYPQPSGVLIQIESPFGGSAKAEPIARQLEKLGITRPVQLTYSDERSVSVVQAYSDWPSYEEAKAMASKVLTQGVPPVVEAANPPAKMLIHVNDAAVVH